MLKVIYLWLIKVVTRLLFNKKRSNVVYLMSFNNNQALIQRMAMALKPGQKLFVMYTSKAQRAAKELHSFGIQTIPMHNGLGLIIHLLPIMMSARLIFCDNYYPFIGGFVLPKQVKIVQLWHANGAIKRFGWEDPKTKRRSYFSQHRFQSVYNHFNQFVVASNAMGKVFQRSYHLPADRMKLIGYPRSDELMSSDWIKQTRAKLYREHPTWQNHRVILYAPTYRDGITFEPPQGLAKILTSDPKAIVLVKLHPLLQNRAHQLAQIWRNIPNLNVVLKTPTMELLTITQTLITDYSSVAFDFSLLSNARSVLFYMFDAQKYVNDPGFQSDLQKWLPTKPIYKLTDLRKAILQNRQVDFKHFNAVWNCYNDGNATQRLIDYYFK